MAQIAFLLLVHGDPEGVIDQARRLTQAGDAVAIHYDARAPQADVARVARAVAEMERVAMVADRHRCGWGDWSLVAATLAALRLALGTWPDATHVYLISGACAPIKPAAWLHARLDAEDRDWIEAVDFHRSGWVKTGILEERLTRRHWFNEREQRRLFYGSLALQRRLGIERTPPEGMTVMIGSQWWCLRRRTAEWVLALMAERPGLARFFRTTWIPDETFIQTLVRHLVPAAETSGRPPTFLMFSDYGFPVTFHNDHYDLLVGQDAFFARKLAPGARELRRRLGSLWASGRTDLTVTDEGRRVQGYLSGLGRDGHRFAPRIWETGARVGRGRRVLVVACKKWHVGKAVAGAIGAATGLRSHGYVFEDAGADLPDLGHLAHPVAKRGRHPRAFVRLLAELSGRDEVLICADPASLDRLRDLAGDTAELRVLLVDAALTEEFAAGHAGRVGLLHDRSGPEVRARVVAAVRDGLRGETDRLLDARLPHVTTLRETAGPRDKARAYERFLGCDPAVAEGLAGAHVFAD